MLAVGIVIGTSFARRSPATEGEKRTIQRYADSMRALKTEIEKSAAEAKRVSEMNRGVEEWCSAVMPTIVRGRLTWRNVAVVQTGDYDDLTGSIKRAIELAGGRVTSVTDISRNFPFYDDDAVARVLAERGLDASAAGTPRERLLAIIADTLADGRHADILSKVEDAEAAKFEGDYHRSNKLVVLVGGASTEDQNTAELVDAALVFRLRKLGVVVVGCESSKTVGSYIDIWHKSGIATVDNADSAMGQAAMVFALKGEMAKFGVRPDADRAVPRTLSTE